jgi:hypothetical protein
MEKKRMIVTIIILITVLIIVAAILWSKHNIKEDAIRKAHEDDQIDKLLRIMR